MAAPLAAKLSDVLEQCRQKQTPLSGELLVHLGRSLSEQLSERAGARLVSDNVWLLSTGEVLVGADGEGAERGQPERIEAVAKVLYEAATLRGAATDAPLVQPVRMDLPARIAEAIDRALGRVPGPKFAHLPDLRDALGDSGRVGQAQLSSFLAREVALQEVPASARPAPKEVEKQTSGGWEGPLSWPIWILGALAWLALIIWVKVRYDF